ncbi:hypothetical protein NXX80_22200 [Bacteroides faecis]|nr:hypothetical protein [Bacteroides faecis]
MIISLFKMFVGAAICLFASCSDEPKDYWGDLSDRDDSNEEVPVENPNASKPRYIWIDAAANFPDFANSKRKHSP